MKIENVKEHVLEDVGVVCEFLVFCIYIGG
jgi:hypothetical protein